MTTISLGFSPCPNDTFIFDALVNKKINTGNFVFEPVLEDVQTLNQWAMQGKLDVTKISYGVLPLILEKYIVLNSGGALGKGVGPLLISREKENDWKAKIKDYTIAIPGENTTAHLLFSLAYPEALHKKFLVFNEIENAVLNGEADAGVIIHENRFTYQHKGLVKLEDLGEYWETTTQFPIPLGGIVAKRTLPVETIKQIDALIMQSIEYAFKHYATTPSPYVKQHAQEMSESVMMQHINLYVNEFSLNLGKPGKQAVLKLMEVYNNIHQKQQSNLDSLFAND